MQRTHGEKRAYRETQGETDQLSSCKCTLRADLQCCWSRVVVVVLLESSCRHHSSFITPPFSGSRSFSYTFYCWTHSVTMIVAVWFAAEFLRRASRDVNTVLLWHCGNVRLWHYRDWLCAAVKSLPSCAMFDCLVKVCRKMFQYVRLWFPCWHRCSILTPPFSGSRSFSYMFDC